MNSKTKKEFHEEAEEDRELDDEERVGEDQNIQGEDLGDFQDKDYVPIKDLDEYNKEELDSKSYSEMSMSQRIKADEEIERRHRRGNNRKNVPIIHDDDERDSLVEPRFQ